ncbi:hypothetical protein ACFOWM_01845 [Ferruginibacter yonginensis]|uniref:Uncharacterized protein n=1 Tax=Ferruginibacter yonginensis TaxID=1310416 RepID=A0ABV8QNA8_9BACT
MAFLVDVNDLCLLGYDYAFSPVYQFPRVIFADDEMSINKDNAQQVCHFINSMALTYRWKNFDLKGAHLLERIIVETAPNEIYQYVHLKNWIKINYYEQLQQFR